MIVEKNAFGGKFVADFIGSGEILVGAGLGALGLLILDPYDFLLLIF